MSYVDAILHIADLAALPEGALDPFGHSPPVVAGAACLTYARFAAETATAVAALPGLTVLAQAPYAGSATPDAVYAALAADPAARALYDAVWPRTPYAAEDGEGGTVTVTPPERFGQLG